MTWEEAEKRTKVFSIILIPVFIAIFGWKVQQSLANSATNKEYVGLAVNILTSDTQNKQLKEYALGLMINFSPTDIPIELQDSLLSGEVNLYEALNDIDTLDKKYQVLLTRDLEANFQERFWPGIVKKQEVFRNKADELGKKIKIHPCSTSLEHCSESALADYHTITRLYRDYSVAAEYILHLAYAEESKIKSNSIETYFRKRSTNKEIILKKATQGTSEKIEGLLKLNEEELLQKINSNSIKKTIERIILDDNHSKASG